MTLLEITNIMFKSRQDWHKVSDDDKIKNAFIITRFFSKMYPEYSRYLNQKGIDPIVVMDTWFHFMDKKPYPRWFWSKSNKTKVSKEKQDLIGHLNISDEDIDFLMTYFLDQVKEELKIINKRKKWKKT